MIDSSKHQWSNYFLAGYKVRLSSPSLPLLLIRSFQGMLEHLHKEDAASVAFLVHGTVPQGSGLSSSSALVCSSALATLFAQEGASPMTRTALADLCCKSERYIGTMGGGMDQAISFLASRGTAKLIDFEPLRSHDVHLPDG
jgi:N-acetylgalactosamine kinase